MKMEIEKIDFEKSGGLVPAIVQDEATLEVLMLGYMDKEAAQKTLESQKVTFYSRSKKRLWQKGESSGHTLDLAGIAYDCDKDTLLIKARPNGPTCHLGSQSCFKDAKRNPLSFLGSLEKTILERKTKMPEGSYTTTLFASGMHKMAQKVGEEGVEVALAAVDSSKERFLSECADLVYHTMVLAAARGQSFKDICAELEKRHGGG